MDERSSLPRILNLERFIADNADYTKYWMGVSEIEPLLMKDVTNMADTECKALWDNLDLGYTEGWGHPLLRSEVSQLHEVTSDDVLVTAPQEGIFIAMHCLIDHCKRVYGDEKPHVVATFPAYQSLYEHLVNLKCDVNYWIAQDTPTGWVFDLDHLKKLLRKDTRILVVNFPHNPTGYIPSKDDWMEILQMCRNNNIFIFSDEMYRLTNHDESPPLSSACAVLENSITLFGMSKTFALPGLRIGWLCTKNHAIMESMKSFKDYTTICSSAPSEILSIIALRNRVAIIDRTRRIINTNLGLLADFFKDFNNILEWKPSKGATIGLCQLKGWTLEVGSGGATAFCEKLVKDTGVLLLPTKVYDYPDIYIRVALGRTGLEEGLKVWRQFMVNNQPSG